MPERMRRAQVVINIYDQGDPEVVFEGNWLPMDTQTAVYQFRNRYCLDYIPRMRQIEEEKAKIVAKQREEEQRLADIAKREKELIEKQVALDKEKGQFTADIKVDEPIKEPEREVTETVVA